MHRTICSSSRFLAAALALACTMAAGEAGADWNPRGNRAASADDIQLPVNPLSLTPLVWSVIANPIFPVLGSDGRIHLAYEMLFTNLGASPVTLVAVEVVDPTRDNQPAGVNRVLTIRDEDVTTEMRRLALTRPRLDRSDYSAILEPGRSAILYLDVTFANRRSVPDFVSHRVTMSTGAGSDKSVLTGIGGVGRVSPSDAVVLSPPLRGDRWVNASGCCEVVSPHRNAILPVNGTLRPPEKYAIDFIQLDKSGSAYVGDPAQLTSWHFYGAPVYSAAAGTVVAAVNDLPDQVPGKSPEGLPPAQAAGNQVIVDIGGGRYILYAHLAPASVLVSEGEHVARGQLLGRVGNSGNTDAPHLHFHVVNRPSALDADGLPFVFDRMELQGRYTATLDDFNDAIFAGKAPSISRAGSGPRRRSMPLTKDVLGFR